MPGVEYVIGALGNAIQEVIANDVNSDWINCIGLFMYLFSCLLRQDMSHIS